MHTALSSAMNEYKMEHTSSTIKLTIGIPTFEAWDYLEPNLHILFAEFAKYNDVEILVCNNASSDPRYGAMERHCDTYPGRVRYIRHAQNLGLDANIWSVVEHARGEYVHFLGDDDFYEPNGLDRLLKVLKEHDPDYCLLGNRYLNTLNRRYIANHDSLGDGIMVSGSAEMIIRTEALRSLTLSNIVIRRSSCLAIENVPAYFGCQWLHLALFIQSLRPCSSAYIFGFSRPIVTVRIANQRWLQNDGAIAFYCRALTIFEGVKRIDSSGNLFRHVTESFRPLLSNGPGIKFRRAHRNLPYLAQLARYYYRSPQRFAWLCANVLLRPHRPFFKGWENVGEEVAPSE